MFPNASTNVTSAEERRLMRQFRKLDESARRSLLDFADFLVGRGPEGMRDAPVVAHTPLEIPRPESESVVKAIKRLTKTYPMIDATRLFNETSSLMTQHVMQGRESGAIIDELESLFLDQFQKLKKDPQ